MKRSSVQIEDVAGWDNVCRAVHRAATGKHRDRDVLEFFARLDQNVADLCRDIRSGTIVVGDSFRFHIRDPKPRVIHAPCFRERVLHHALMYFVGPVLDRSLIADTFACRVGKGTLAAVHRCQQHIRRFPWFAKMDIRKYFASIDHALLKDEIARKFKCQQLVGLINRIIEAHSDSPHRGLPMGALTSQHFANFYLGRLDRYLLEHCRVRGFVRYMDDFLFWRDSKSQVLEIESACRRFLGDQLQLTAKDNQQINRSDQGITFCGYRIFPGTIRLAASRRQRFRFHKRQWERLWLNGQITSKQLQRGFDAALAITLHADAARWRGGLAADHAGWHDDV